MGGPGRLANGSKEILVWSKTAWVKNTFCFVFKFVYEEHVADD